MRARGLSKAERAEVDETLRRIKLRRVGHATRHVELYPSWLIFLAGVQLYLTALLAGQNLIALGEAERGKRLQIVGVLLYLVLGGALLAFALGVQAVPGPLKAAIALAIPLGFAAYYTKVQHAASVAAREAGAQGAPILLPALFGMILAIAQAFAVWFLQLQLAGGFSS
jgi:hypothetical protein